MVTKLFGLLMGCLLVAMSLLTGPAVVGAEAEADAEMAVSTEELAAFGLSDEEQRLMALINAARAEAGLPVLAPEETLASLAGERSDDMATRHYFDHTTPEGRNVLQMLQERGVDYQYAGETLQMNNYPAPNTVAEAAKALLASPAHQAILLDGRFSHLGVGHAVDGKLHYYTIVVVQYW